MGGFPWRKAPGFQAFQQLTGGGSQVTCTGIDQHFMFSRGHQQAGVRTLDVSGWKFALAKAAFYLFLRHIGEEPAERIRERTVTDGDALNFSNIETRAV